MADPVEELFRDKSQGSTDDHSIKRAVDRKGAHPRNDCSDLEKEVWRLEEALETTKGQVKRYSCTANLLVIHQCLRSCGNCYCELRCISAIDVLVNMLYELHLV